jgi:hypothetical protein
MSNGWKGGRVAHVFGVQLPDKIVAKQSCFHCFLTAVHLFPVSVFIFSKMINLGSSDVFVVVFQMNMDNYPHITITADGSLCSTGQHRPNFPRVLYDTLRQLGYDGDAPVYRGRMSMAHGQDKCEVNVVIPLNPMEPWMATVIGVKLDYTVEQTAQVTLISLCETRLADTAAIPITLFPIRNQEDPMWKQRLEAVSNPEGPHFYAGMAALAGYA